MAQGTRGECDETATEDGKAVPSDSRLPGDSSVELRERGAKVKKHLGRFFFSSIEALPVSRHLTEPINSFVFVFRTF